MGHYLVIALGAGCLGAFVSVIAGRQVFATILLVLGVTLLIMGVK